ERSQGRIFLQLPSGFNDIDQVKLKDTLSGKTYIKKIENIVHHGLYVDLQPYKSHFFNFNPL
ncbi:MAG: hypothetical protein ACXACR_14580, partial [Candidatus Hodarchaeales archaeon]